MYDVHSMVVSSCLLYHQQCDVDPSFFCLVVIERRRTNVCVVYFEYWWLDFVRLLLVVLFTKTGGYTTYCSRLCVTGKTSVRASGRRWLFDDRPTVTFWPPPTTGKEGKTQANKQTAHATKNGYTTDWLVGKKKVSSYHTDRQKTGAYILVVMRAAYVWLPIDRNRYTGQHKQVTIDKINR